MKPLLVDLLAEARGEVPLDLVVGRHCGQVIDGRCLLRAALDEGRLDNQINKARARLEKEAEAAGKPVPEDVPLEQGVEFLQEWYREQVVPLADWRNESSTADDVYDAVLMGWKEARDRYELDANNKQYLAAVDRLRSFHQTVNPNSPEDQAELQRLQQEVENAGEYGKVKKRLDAVREEWRENPNAVFYQDTKTGDVISPEELERELLGIEHEDESKQETMRAKTKAKYEQFYVHKIGKKYGFSTEKEHLAGIMAWWLVAGLVGSSTVGDRRPDFGDIRWINAPDTGGIAKPDPETAAREKAAAAAKQADINRSKMGSMVGEVPHTGQGHMIRDPGTGKGVVSPAARHGGSSGPGQFTPGQASGPPSGSSGGPPKKTFRKRPAQEDLINRLADAISEDPDDTWRADSPILDEGWQDELDELAAGSHERVDASGLAPSSLSSMSDYYASVVESGPGRFIYLARDMGALQEHPEASGGHIMPADEVPQHIDDDEFILNGGRIEVLDEDLDYDNALTDAEAAEVAVAGLRRKVRLAENIIAAIERGKHNLERRAHIWAEQFSVLAEALGAAGGFVPRPLAQSAAAVAECLSGRSIRVRQLYEDLKALSAHGSAFLGSRRARFLSEGLARLGRLIYEADPAAAAAPPAAGGAAPQPAAAAGGAAGAAGAQPGAAGAQPGAAAAGGAAAGGQPSPEIEKANQEGGKLVDGLVKQLQLLQKAPDWETVKKDLVTKLKPFLG